MNNHSQATPPGWYSDPSRRNEYRWWNGERWTDNVATNGSQRLDPLTPPTAPSIQEPHQGRSDAADSNARSFAEHERAVTRAAAPAEVRDQATGQQMNSTTESRPADAADSKVTMFSAKRIALELQQETRDLRARNKILEGVVNDLGGLESVEIAGRIESMRADEARERRAAADRAQGLAADLVDLTQRIGQARGELESITREILVARETVELEARGLFDYEHVAEASQGLAANLAGLRSRVKEMNKYDRAIHATTGFTYNGSSAKGTTLVNQMRRIMLRAYNAEAENAVKTVKTGNLGPAQRRLDRARDQIEKQGKMMSLRVDSTYHQLRLEEISLAARHHEAVAAEKALERERREELREQRRAESELEAERERLRKEQSHYRNSIRKLREAGNDTGADQLERELQEIERAIKDVDYRAANIRAGYVYVISNIGAFGPGVVKIGMTRRLEPMDRIKELGDASVPFVFDVHALFFSKDAVGVESALHREFAEQRLNQVNMRKEFFRVTPDEVLLALNKQQVSVLEFRTDAAADDYRTSVAIAEQRRSKGRGVPEVGSDASGRRAARG